MYAILYFLNGNYEQMICSVNDIKDNAKCGFSYFWTIFIVIACQSKFIF